jgi:hypothetical protein
VAAEAILVKNMLLAVVEERYEDAGKESTMFHHAADE